MGITSGYTQLKVFLKPEIAEAFRRKCTSGGASMASVITDLVTVGGPVRLKGLVINVDTRQQRRKAIGKIIAEIEAIMTAELQYSESIPENLRGSIRYEAAEEAVSALEEAIDILSGVY